LLDLRLGDEDGFLIFEQSKILGKSPEIIIMTGFSEQENILRALKLGARDFLQKPVNLDDLKKALERTFAFEQMRRRIKSLSKSVTFFQDELNKNYNLRIIGNSAKIIKVYELAKLAAESPDASVFITGQSGTGKELVARFIHNASSRKKKFFML
jgi:DNA-binding NtrC family response regulator